MLCRALGSFLVAFALIGCQLVLGIEEPLTRGPDDPSHPQFGCGQWDALYFEPCAIEEPIEAMVLDSASYRYDTDHLELDDGLTVVDPVAEVIAVDGVEFALISVLDLEIAEGAEFRVVGSRGLILVSWGEARIAGLVDGGSRLGEPGAGSRGDCAASTGTDSLTVGSGGGGGGGYGGDGGRGGDGDNGGKSGGDGGSDREAPVLPLGGCAGGAAGSVVDGVTPAVGGPGGGAIHLSARGDIRIAGVVDVGGAGGGGGEFDGGGAGGGSGGFLSLDGAAITIEDPAILVSNGGAGGEGGDIDDEGNTGGDGQRLAEAAAGGRGRTPNGGNGGTGGYGDAPAGGEGVNGASEAGGGGGGGSVGYIMARSEKITVSPNATISPPLRTIETE